MTETRAAYLDEAETFHTQRDRLARYGLLGTGIVLFATALVFLLLGEGKVAGASVALGLFAAIPGWGAYHQRLRVTRSGVEMLKWGRTTTVAFANVAQCRTRSTEERFDFGSFPDYDWGGLVIHCVRSLTVRPVIWLIRVIWFSERERAFLDLDMLILDGAGKELLVVRGEDRFVDIHDAWSWITARSDAATQIRTRAVVPNE